MLRQQPYGQGGLLLTDRRYRNFELYLEAKPDWGCNGGIVFRSTEGGSAYQIELDPGQRHRQPVRRHAARSAGPPARWTSRRRGSTTSGTAFRLRVEGDAPRIASRDQRRADVGCHAGPQRSRRRRSRRDDRPAGALELGDGAADGALLRDDRGGPAARIASATSRSGSSTDVRVAAAAAACVSMMAGVSTATAPPPTPHQQHRHGARADPARHAARRPLRAGLPVASDEPEPASQDPRARWTEADTRLMRGDREARAATRLHRHDRSAPVLHRQATK